MFFGRPACSRASRFRITHLIPLVFLCAVFVVPPFCLHAQFETGKQSYEKTAPYNGLTVESGKVRVRIDDDWFKLISIQKVSVERLLEKCEEEDWKPEIRLGEDIVKVLALMDAKVGAAVSMKLRNDSGEVISMDSVPMTRANRRTIRLANNEKNPEMKALLARLNNNPFNSTKPDFPNWGPFTHLRWEGDVPFTKIDGDWVEVRKIHGVTVEKLKQLNDRAVTLVRAEIQADLNVFRERLSTEFSYLSVNDAKWLESLQQIENRIPNEPDRRWLSAELQKVMGMFIDGHARVDGGLDGFEDGFLPFLISVSGDKFAAIKPDRSGLVDAEYPYLNSIDGVVLDRWIEATEVWIADGSPQLRVDRGLRLLRWIQHFRKQLGLDVVESLQLELANEEGQTKTVKVNVSDRRTIYGPWPRLSENRILDENFGYIRLAQMDNDAVDSIRTWMPKFKDTDGLIVDVRTNGGGSRKALIELAGYLMTSDDEPRIANVAAYRLAAGFERDHLSGSRFVYRESSTKFDDRDRAAIAKFKKSFQPEWELPKDQFSEWHYLVVSKSASDSRYDYRKPVVILMDERCFSATDIFLGAFKGWPNVTLVGVASGGGSACSKGFKLPNSDVRITCASMASFQPNGRLYDTNGVQPDVLIKRPPEFFTSGGEDVDLQKALVLLTQDERK